MSGLRLSWLLPLYAAAAACATAPRPGAVTADAGCFSLIVDDRYGALWDATGLRDLPALIALDSTPVGPRGRRILVPPTWRDGVPNVAWASWRFEGVGLVLTFLGPSGTVEMAFRRTLRGYVGETVTPFRHALPPVEAGLVPSSCGGLRAAAI
jgi:hypothetical protein